MAACVAGIAVGQPTPAETPTTAQPQPPAQAAPIAAHPLSTQCTVPANQISVPAPLPNLVGRLEAGEPVRILAIGSSSTWGVGATSSRKNYPSQLEGMLERVLKNVAIEMINRGVSGETAGTTADRLRMEASLIKPDVVLWQVGTNDAVQRIPVEQFERVVSKTVAALKRKKIDVVLVGLQYTPKYARDEHYFSIREALKRVAAEQNVVYVRRFQAMEYIAKTKASLQMMAEDEFHLNDLGYQCMAEHVAQAVTANIFVRRRKPGS